MRKTHTAIAAVKMEGGGTEPKNMDNLTSWKRQGNRFPYRAQ
jgi:hypothetical protein